MSDARSTQNSTIAFAKAQQVMPGGVNSPVRAFKAVGGTPIFLKEGEGCIVRDIDGNAYIDYVASYGPLIVGHTNERVVAALSKAIGRGTSFGAPTELETHLAATIISALPAMEMVRFVNSGTEAAMSAVRLARAATGRELIVKCIGCYHRARGWSIGRSRKRRVDTGHTPAARGFPGPLPPPRFQLPTTTCPPPGRCLKNIQTGSPVLPSNRSQETWGWFLPLRGTCRGCETCATSTARCSCSTK